MKRRSLAASRDSKRDVTANPIRKTAKSAAAGQESRRQAVEVAAVDLRGLNIGVQSLWCCQWNWVVQNCPATNGVEERIPCESIPKCSSSMSHILRHTREAASREAQRHTCKTLHWLAVTSQAV